MCTLSKKKKNAILCLFLKNVSPPKRRIRNHWDNIDSLSSTESNKCVSFKYEYWLHNPIQCGHGLVIGFGEKKLSNTILAYVKVTVDHDNRYA